MYIRYSLPGLCTAAVDSQHQSYPDWSLCAILIPVYTSLNDYTFRLNIDVYTVLPSGMYTAGADSQQQSYPDRPSCAILIPLYNNLVTTYFFLVLIYILYLPRYVYHLGRQPKAGLPGLALVRNIKTFI